MEGAENGNSIHPDGGFDGVQGFRQAGQRLRPYHRAHPVSASRSSLAAAVLCLAGLRSVPRISRTAPLFGVLAREVGRPAAFGAGGTLQADQAGRTQGDRRRVPAALVLSSSPRRRGPSTPQPSRVYWMP